jgi:hypothetical protein
MVLPRSRSFNFADAEARGFPTAWSDVFELYKVVTERSKQLHDDIWNGLRFFTAIQLAVLTATGAIAAAQSGNRSSSLVIVLLVFGFASALMGRRVLRSHRIYYLDAQRVKMILEDRLALTTGVSTRETHRIHALAVPWTAIDETREFLEEWGRDREGRLQPLADEAIFGGRGKHRPLVRQLDRAYIVMMTFDVVAIVIVAAFMIRG